MIIIRLLFFTVLLSIVVSAILYLFTGKVHYLTFVKNTIKLFIVFAGVLLIVAIVDRFYAFS